MAAYEPKAQAELDEGTRQYPPGYVGRPTENRRQAWYEIGRVNRVRLQRSSRFARKQGGDP
jgi:hypothetical protein